MLLNDDKCCELCGEYIGDSNGYPPICEDCYEERGNQNV